MSSNFPNDFDDDTTLPPINDNIQDLGAEAINALRDTVFNTQQYLGLGGAGITSSISERLGISLEPDGSIKSSAIASLGLVTLPITNDQISNSAEIPESKLKLDHRTQDLFNYIQDLSNGVSTSLGWISLTGIKLEPHLLGAIYRHELNQIDVNSDPSKYLFNRFNALRDNHDSYTLVNDMNNELLFHQFSDGSGSSAQLITTVGGSTYPANYGHTASGIWLNTSRFSTVPQTAQDLQQFADFVDSSSIFLLGTRIQNLYTNGISRSSRSSSLITDGYGVPVIPNTTAITYLLNIGSSSFPVDDINVGDDIIELKPLDSEISSNSFDEKFALIKIGDIIRVNYGAVEVSFVIKEKKYVQNGGVKKYVVRIAGKNLFYTTNATVRIDRPLFNNNKHGVLAIAPVNNTFNEIPSLIIGSPYGAQVLGIGFNPDQLNASHYLLYLVLYTTGHPQDGGTVLPAIDVTGNRGKTPGLYTLDSVVEATNTAFRQAGFNYRFIAFSHQGEFGIMLADSYRNAGFSIVNAVVASDGTYDSLATGVSFPNNVIDVFAGAGTSAIDPLGFGVNGGNWASPQYQTSYGSTEAALIPTKIFLPLKRNNFYVNGIERDKLALDIDQLVDGYGDGYWNATIQAINVFPGPAPNGRVQVTYRVPLDLSTSGLKVGKTLVVQSAGHGNLVDFGRFIIQDVTFNIPVCPTPTPDTYTDITVFDAVHATGVSPTSTLAVGNVVEIGFNYGSVSFNRESATDFSNVRPFKRHFEVYVDQNGKSFTHERSRVNNSGATFDVNGVPLRTFSELSKLNIIKVSSKLRGYQFGSVNKITLHITDLNNLTGVFVGNLLSYDGLTSTHNGPITTGKLGQVTRFYDETNIDYIDVLFDNNTSIAAFVDQYIDFQLFPTLSLDEEIMLIGTCQLNDVTNTVNYLRDERQFGNTSEKDLSTSALGFISLPEKLLHSNGVLRGFDLQDPGILTNPNGNQIYLNGGLVLVNGKLISINNETVTIPVIKESFGSLYDINWLICVNDKGEYQPIPLLDFDQWLSTPTDPTRRFRAINVVNGLLYYLDASTFSDIINKRKDLVPLYIVASSVTVSTTPIVTLTVTDARRYVNDADSNLPLRLTSDEAQGNFKKPEAIFSWIKYNNKFNGTAFVKGANVSNATITARTYLDFTNSVVIDGVNDALLTMNGDVVLGSNITLKNLDIIFNGLIFVPDGSKNIIFDNCNITVNVPSTAPNNTVFSIVNGDNVVFKDSTLNVQFTSLYDSVNVFRGSVFYLNNTLNFKVDNCVITTNYVISAGIVTPGNVFTLVNAPICSITNSVITGNFNKLVDITDSNFFKLVNVGVTSTYNPNAGGTADSYNGVSYDPLNLVNSGQGYICGHVTTVLDDILIENVIFNYAPATNSNDRYSFINFELTTLVSVLSSLQIKNCKFMNLNVSGVKDDIRAAISIINTATTISPPVIQPALLNSVISNNYCNKNQAIVLTSILKFGNMLFPSLTVHGCEISNNICGTIGYLVGSETKIISMSPVVNAFNDKTAGLTIRDNICHYIANLDSTGKYFLMSRVGVSSPFVGVSIDQIQYSTGNVDIVRNKCNWIHTGIAYEENSTLKILDNTLSAYDTTYLVNYGENLPNAIYNPAFPLINVSSAYAIFVSSNKHTLVNTQTPGEGNDSCCVISRNVTNTGYWDAINFAPVSLKYGLGYIYCQSSCTITDNVLKGVGETFSYGSLILLGGKTSIVENNRIYRGTNSIFAYVAFANFETPSAWDGAESKGVIMGNFFDSPFINDILPQTITTDKVIRLDDVSTNAKNWIAERNINQTVTTTFNVSAGQHTYGTLHRVFPGTVPGGTDIWSQDDPTATVRIIYTSGSGLFDNYQWTIPVYALIPKRTRIVKAFVTVTNTAFTTTSSQYTLSIVDPVASLTDSDTGNLQFTMSDSLIVTPSVNTYQNTEDGTTMVRFNLSMQSSNSLTVLIGNIHVQYRW